MITCIGIQSLICHLWCIFPPKLFQKSVDRSLTRCVNFYCNFFTSRFSFALDFFHSYFCIFFTFSLPFLFMSVLLFLLKTNVCFWKSVIVTEKVAVTMVNRWAQKIEKKNRCVWVCNKNGYLTIIQVQKWNKRLKWMSYVCTEYTRIHREVNMQTYAQ